MMTPEQRILAKLLLIEEEMKNIELWQLESPAEQAFESVEPFCIDTMSAHEWLQWVLIPRLSSMIENEMPKKHLKTIRVEMLLIYLIICVNLTQCLNHKVNNARYYLSR